MLLLKKGWFYANTFNWISYWNTYSTNSEGSGPLYVSISANNVYSYRYEIKSSLGTETSKEYEVKKLSEEDGKIIESEDENCKIPVLKVYSAKPKISKWTFGILGERKYSYVFYVPEGTIQKDVKLK